MSFFVNTSRRGNKKKKEKLVSPFLICCSLNFYFYLELKLVLAFGGVHSVLFVLVFHSKSGYGEFCPNDYSNVLCINQFYPLKNLFSFMIVCEEVYPISVYF